MSIVSLNGLTKHEALAALFNYARPQGLGMRSRWERTTRFDKEETR